MVVEGLVKGEVSAAGSRLLLLLLLLLRRRWLLVVDVVELVFSIFSLLPLYIDRSALVVFRQLRHIVG